MPVVKADAYRHGAVEVSRVLEAEGARWLAVSNVEEGVALRQAESPRAFWSWRIFSPSSAPRWKSSI
jgi:alanine racemase